MANFFAYSNKIHEFPSHINRQINEQMIYLTPLKKSDTLDNFFLHFQSAIYRSILALRSSNDAGLLA